MALNAVQPQHAKDGYQPEHHEALQTLNLLSTDVHAAVPHLKGVLRTLEELAEAVSSRTPSTSAVVSTDMSRDNVCLSNRTGLNGAAAGPPILAVIIDSLSSLLFLHPDQQVIKGILLEGFLLLIKHPTGSTSWRILMLLQGRRAVAEKLPINATILIFVVSLTGLGVHRQIATHANNFMHLCHSSLGARHHLALSLIHRAIEESFHCRTNGPCKAA